MVKPLRAWVIATVGIQVCLDDPEDILEAPDLQEAVQWEAGEALNTVVNGVESYDRVIIRDYGDFAEEIAECPECDEHYVLKRDVERIEQYGHCGCKAVTRYGCKEDE
jgi:hypothetical protein